MPGDVWHARALRGAWSSAELLARFVIAAGLCASVLFVVVGLQYELQMYGDGSIFSYAVAVQDAWAFHWHNISGRAFSFLYSSVPAQAYVAATGDARGGIVLYGLLHFSAPLLGLAATFAADRSKDRLIFIVACGSTAGICPLIFGFPTEVLDDACAVVAGAGGEPFRPSRPARICGCLRRNAGAFVHARERADLCAKHPVHARAAWATRSGFTARCAGVLDRPDDCDRSADSAAAGRLFRSRAGAGRPESVRHRALQEFRMFLLVSLVLVIYGIALASLRRMAPAWSDRMALAMVGIALAVFWLCFDRGLFAENRYYMRTVVLLATPALGVIAGLYVAREEMGFLAASGLSTI